MVSPYVNEKYEFYLDYHNEDENKIFIRLNLCLKEDKT